MENVTSMARQFDLDAERQANNLRLWQDYSKGRDTLGINLGSGGALKADFLNCDLHPRYDDVFALDVTRPFPWASATFDFVFTEHMIEHISYHQGQVMLKECFRVLKPGGVIRVVTPSIEFLIGLFHPDRRPVESEYVAWAQAALTPDAPAPLASFVFNTFVRSWGHTFLYDRPTLRLALGETGFQQIQDCAISRSAFPFLTNLEAVYRMPEGFLELESMILEARKP